MAPLLLAVMSLWRGCRACGAFYARPPSFEVAAFLHRKARDLEEKPRWWPETPHWFVHVVDRTYARDWVAHHTGPARSPAAGDDANAPPAYPEDKATKAEYEAIISEMASTKGFPT